MLFGGHRSRFARETIGPANDGGASVDTLLSVEEEANGFVAEIFNPDLEEDGTGVAFLALESDFLSLLLFGILGQCFAHRKSG